MGGYAILTDPSFKANPRAPIRAEEISHADLILISHGSWMDHTGYISPLREESLSWIRAMARAYCNQSKRPFEIVCQYL